MSCQNKSPPGVLRVQRLWNNSESAVDEYLRGFVITNPGTILLQGSRAILRRDYMEMHDKVKLISGGGAGNEPAHAGFVGPGMLTAAVIGDVFSAPPSESILKVIQLLGTNHSPGVLMIVQNYTGYSINFGLAKSRAQNEGLLVAMLIVGDDACSKSLENTAGRRGLVGTLFIHKIAGAMAEEGRTLEEICALCKRILNSRGISTIGLGSRVPLQAGINTYPQNSTTEQIELGLGIHGEPGISKVCFTTAKDLVLQMIDIMMDGAAKSSSKLTKPDGPGTNGEQIALIINDLGGLSQIELGIFAMEVIQQLTSWGLCVERVYMGTLMTSLDTIGFQFSILKLSLNSNLKKYLDASTDAPAWPKVLASSELGSNRSESSTNMEIASFGQSCETDQESGIPDVEPCGPVLNERTAQVFLMILTFACEALISCAEQLNIMDEDSGDGDCGRSLAQGGSAIRAAIRENQILGSRPYVALRQISYIIEREMCGIMGGLYSIFFDAGAKEFAKRSQKDPVNVCMWLNALAAGNKAIMDYGQANLGDRTMLDPLITAQNHLAAALEMNLHPIRALGDAVKAAETRASETLKMPGRVGRASLVMSKQFKYPDPGAHAVGIWMRAAYEGVKLKMACECEEKEFQ